MTMGFDDLTLIYLLKETQLEPSYAQLGLTVRPLWSALADLGLISDFSLKKV